MTKLEEFYQTLMNLRKPQIPVGELDEGGDRTNHCYLKYVHSDDKEHIFQVRGWSTIIDSKLSISVVNWTLCAGPARLTLSEEDIDSWEIKKIV